MYQIVLNNIHLFAYHGCFEEEAKLGANYNVSIEVTGKKTDFEAAAVTDDLSHTIDYVQIYDIIKQEMRIRSKLLEAVGQRIMHRLSKEVEGIQKVKLSISKLHPPIEGSEIDSFTLVLEEVFSCYPTH